MLGNFEASIGGLDQLTGARLVMDRRRRLVPPFQKTPAVGSAVSLDEAASQQETAHVAAVFQHGAEHGEQSFSPCRVAEVRDEVADDL